MAAVWLYRVLSALGVGGALLALVGTAAILLGVAGTWPAIAVCVGVLLAAVALAWRLGGIPF
jgi:hypothetical protein